MTRTIAVLISALTIAIPISRDANAIEPVLMESAVNPACGHLYHVIGGEPPELGISWPEAESAAKQLGGHLVTINDAKENEWVGKTFRNRFYLWIGLNDVKVEGKYVWSSGETSPYRNWSPGEPNNFRGNEDYGQMFTFPKGAPWNDNRLVRTVGTYPAFGVAEVTPPLTAKLVFRENKTSKQTVDEHVGLFLAVRGRVIEAHPGYQAADYIDPAMQMRVRIPKNAGVQWFHTLGSFQHNGTKKNVPASSTKTAEIPFDLALLMSLFMESEVGASYSSVLFPTSNQKGARGCYTGAGLIERAAEEAGINGGQGFVPDAIESVIPLSPALLRLAVEQPELVLWH